MRTMPFDKIAHRASEDTVPRQIPWGRVRLTERPRARGDYYDTVSDVRLGTWRGLSSGPRLLSSSTLLRVKAAEPA